MGPTSKERVGRRREKERMGKEGRM